MEKERERIKGKVYKCMENINRKKINTRKHSKNLTFPFLSLKGWICGYEIRVSDKGKLHEHAEKRRKSSFSQTFPTILEISLMMFWTKFINI